MDISYRIEDDLDWNNAEAVEVEPEGWKRVVIRYIDAYPFLFWRINEIDKNFRSSSHDVSALGVHDFFSQSLKSMKIMVLGQLDEMHPERRKFYEENIVELFNE
jgi:hypothetical protein